MPRLVIVVRWGLVLVAVGLVSPAASGQSAAERLDVVRVFEELLAGDDRTAAAVREIEAHWEDAFVPMLLDAMRVATLDPPAFRIAELLRRKTAQDFGIDINAWYDWAWKRGLDPHPRHGDVKAALYGRIDPRFRGYFGGGRKASVRLDEVRWGGVGQDGIPPLRRPKMIAAADASYLADADVVFGIEVGGDVRAYPKRILAWHEMFVDAVGGVEVTGVY